MSSWAAAEAWRRRGFRVFPLRPASKTPAIENYPAEASNDPAAVARFWQKWPNANVGVALGHGVHVLDVDVKSGAEGLESFKRLGLTFDTLTVQTPSGGYHLYYSSPVDYVNKVGFRPGLDFRSYGGMVVGPDTFLGWGFGYDIKHDGPVAPIPGSLAALLPVRGEDNARVSRAALDAPRSVEAAIHWLREAPPAIQGLYGDDTTFKTAAALCADYALSAEKAFELLSLYYNPRCVPPWSEDELRQKAANGAEYAKGDIGSKSPDYQFQGIVMVPQPELAPAPGGDDWPELGRFGNVIPRIQRKPKRWVVKNLICRQRISALIAPGGTGKSTIALYAAACIALGHPFAPGWAASDPGKVIVFNMEETRDSMSEKLELLCAEHRFNFKEVVKNINLLTIDDFPLELVNAKCVPNEMHIAALKKAAMRAGVVAIVVDPLVQVHKANEQSNTEMSEVTRALASIARDTDTGLLFIHHTSKSNINRPIRHGDPEVSRGAAAITDNTQHVLTLFPLSNDECAERGVAEEDRRLYTRLDIAKSNIAPNNLPPVYFWRDDVRQEDGDTLPVFRVHSWESSETEERDTLGKIIADLMAENNTGKVKHTEVIDRWRLIDPIRDKLSNEQLQSALKSLYHPRGHFQYIDEDNQTLTFYHGKDGKYNIFTMKPLTIAT